MTREQWREEGFAFGEVKKESVYMLTGPKTKLPRADPGGAELQEPRQRGRLGVGARALPAASGRGGRRVHPDRDLRHPAGRRGRRGGRACAPATRGAARTASRSATSSRGPTSRRSATVLAEGCWGHLTGAAIKEFDLGGGPRAAGLGARRQGGLEGPEAAGPGDSHVRAAVAAEGLAPSTGSSAARGSIR